MTRAMRRILVAVVVVATLAAPSAAAASESPPGGPGPDLRVGLVAGTTNVVAGTALSYSAEVTNAGEHPAVNVTLHLPVRAGITFDRLTHGSDWQCDAPAQGTVAYGLGTEATCNRATLAVGERASTVSITVVIPHDYEQESVRVWGVVDSPSEPEWNYSYAPDYDAPANLHKLDFTVSRVADVALAMTGPASPVIAGSDATYTARVRNDGPSSSRQAALFQEFPPELRFEGPTPACALTASSTWVRCGVPSLSPGEEVLVPVAYRVVEAGSGRAVVNGMVTVAISDDPDTDNNVAWVATELRPGADLAVRLSNTPTEAIAGSQDAVAHLATVTNNGPHPADRVVLRGSVPTARYAKFSPGAPWQGCEEVGDPVDAAFECRLGGTLAVGESVSVDVGVLAPADRSDDISFTAHASSELPDPAQENNTAQVWTQVRSVSDIAVGMTGPLSASVGDQVTYVSVATNRGPSDERRRVWFVNRTPEGTTLESFEGPAGWECHRTEVHQEVFCKTERFAAGDAATLTVSLRVDQRPPSGTLRNKAFAKVLCCGGASDPQPENDQAQVDTTVTAPTTDTTEDPSTDTTQPPTDTTADPPTNATTTTTTPTTDATSDPTTESTNPQSQPPEQGSSANGSTGSGSGAGSGTAPSGSPPPTSGGPSPTSSGSSSPASGGATPSQPATSSGSSSSPAQVVRLAGGDRVETAIAISRDQFGEGGAHAAVLVRSDDYADALAAAPLAFARRGPLLLTGRGSLDDRVLAELRRVLRPGSTVFLVGGETALSHRIASALGDSGFSTDRLWGPDRFGSAVRVAQSLDPEVVLLATGTDFADALAAGAAAAVSRGAVVLTSGSTLPAPTSDFIAGRAGVERWAVGGPAAAADPGAQPIVGRDRYATARMLADRFFARPTAVAVASGTAFPDGLSGGVHAAFRRAPLLLTSPAALPPTTAEYASEQRAGARVALVYGGPAAISEPVVSQLRATLDRA